MRNNGLGYDNIRFMFRGRNLLDVFGNLVLQRFVNNFLSLSMRESLPNKSTLEKETYLTLYY